MIAFSSDDELVMGLTLVKDDTFRLFIKRKFLLLKIRPCQSFCIVEQYRSLLDTHFCYMHIVLCEIVALLK